MTNNDNKQQKDTADKAEYYQAMDRLEDAVRYLGDAAKGNFADRAAQALEQTAAKLRQEGQGNEAQSRGWDDGNAPNSSNSASSAGNTGNFRSNYYRANSASRDNSAQKGHLEHWRGDGASRLFRDLDNGKLWGICAGVAPYLGLERWVVRCLAVTAFVFAPQIIVPAYVIAYFVLDPRSAIDGREVPPSKRQRKREARRARAEEKSQQRSAARATARAERRASGSASFSRPERTPTTAVREVPARSVLRTVRGTLQEAEMRLRRMEGHVTSGRYELQKELRKIEGAPSQ